MDGNGLAWSERETEGGNNSNDTRKLRPSGYKLQVLAGGF